MTVEEPAAQHLHTAGTCWASQPGSLTGTASEAPHAGKVMSRDIPHAWTLLPVCEQASWQEKAANLKADYDDALERYQEGRGDEPKRPMSAYFLWVDYMRRSGKITPSS